jgi:hypothetical protein
MRIACRYGNINTPKKALHGNEVNVFLDKTRSKSMAQVVKPYFGEISQLHGLPESFFEIQVLFPRFRLAETEDWVLVNPLLYPQLPVLRNSASNIDVIETDKFLCTNAELVLVQSDQAKRTEDPINWSL